jgi:hypothetical protein
MSPAYHLGLSGNDDKDDEMMVRDCVCLVEKDGKIMKTSGFEQGCVKPEGCVDI